MSAKPKGKIVLKITGIVFIILGIVNISWSVFYGFVGAMGFDDMGGRSTVVGLLIFYGLFGILNGFFEIGIGALSIRQSFRLDHAVRCIVWGGISLVLGIAYTVCFFNLADMIGVYNRFYPPWYGFAIVIAVGIVLPLLLIFGGILNKRFASAAGPETGDEKNTEDASVAEQTDK